MNVLTNAHKAILIIFLFFEDSIHTVRYCIEDITIPQVLLIYLAFYVKRL